MISQETINVPQAQRPWIDAITHQLFLAIVHKVENNASPLWKNLLDIQVAD